MKEDVVTFGQDRSLVGVISDPPAGFDERPGNSAVLLLNAGLLYHIGPNRLHVKIARRLAAAGHVAMRFDFAGIGDSRPHSDSRPFDQYSIEDVQAAMDYLHASRGIETCILMGLCLGANVALQVAYRDPRVAGIVLINANEYRDQNDPAAADPGTAAAVKSYLRVRTDLRYYASRFSSPGHWLRLVRGKSNLRHIMRALSTYIQRRARARQEPSEVETMADLGRLRDRGTSILIVLSEGSTAWDLYRFRFEKELRALSSGGRLRIEVVQRADHVFTLLWTQRLLSDVVTAWVTGSGSPCPPRSSSLPAPPGHGEAR